MQILDDIVISKYEPSNTDVLWLDVSSEYTQLKAYIDGLWKPIPFVHMNNTYTNNNNQQESQIIKLHDGWNWFSTYISGEPTELIQTFEESVGSSGAIIKSHVSTAEYYEDFGWFGDLNYIGITNDNLYMINMKEPCEVTLSGIPCDPSTVAITLKNSWNWIGYPCQIPHDLEYALKYFDPQEGDIIKNEASKQAVYTNGHWDGTLKVLQPGCGYQYWTNLPAGTTKTVFFNSQNSVIKDISINGQNIYIQSIGIDNTPTENSQNLITSGAVYAALNSNNNTEP